MVRKNVSPSPLVWVALALLVGATGGAEPASAARLAQWLSVWTDHAGITASVRTAHHAHLEFALPPASGAAIDSIFSGDSCADPAAKRRGRPPASSPAHPDRAPPCLFPADLC